MKATELRIGNLVSHVDAGPDFYFVVDTIGLDFNNILAHELTGDRTSLSTHHLDNIVGIPLTEDVLRRCGFDIVDDNPKQKPHYEGDILFKILDFEFSNSGITGFKSWSLNPKLEVKYLHELMNLYLALTGTEMSYNPNTDPTE